VHRSATTPDGTRVTSAQPDGSLSEISAAARDEVGEPNTAETWTIEILSACERC